MRIPVAVFIQWKMFNNIFRLPPVDLPPSSLPLLRHQFFIFPFHTLGLEMNFTLSRHSAREIEIDEERNVVEMSVGETWLFQLCMNNTLNSTTYFHACRMEFPINFSHTNLSVFPSYLHPYLHTTYMCIQPSSSTPISLSRHSTLNAIYTVTKDYHSHADDEKKTENISRQKKLIFIVPYSEK